MSDTDNLHWSVSEFLTFWLFRSMNLSNTSFPLFLLLSHLNYVHVQEAQGKLANRRSFLFGSSFCFAEMLGLCVSSPWPPVGRQEQKGWGHQDPVFFSCMVLDRRAWMGGVFMTFLASVPCAGDSLPHHPKIPQWYKIISGDQPALETHKGNHKVQQLRTNWDVKGTSNPTQLPSNNLTTVFKGQLSLLKVGHFFYIKVKAAPTGAVFTQTSYSACTRQLLLLSYTKSNPLHLVKNPLNHPRTELESFLYTQGWHRAAWMLPVGSVGLPTVMWRWRLPMGSLGRTLGEGPGDQNVLKSPRLPPLTQKLAGAWLAPPQRERPLWIVGKAPGARTGRARPRPEESHPGQLPNSNPRELLMAARKGVGSPRRRLCWAQPHTSNLDTKQARPKVTLCKGDSFLPL